jgi:hypothetical protein
MLKRLLVVLGIWACSTTAYADKLDRTEINKLIKGLNPVVLKYQGQDGIWFSAADAEKILEALQKKLPLALDIIDSQDSQIATLKTSVDLYKATVASYSDYANYNKSMLDTALKYFPDLRPPEEPFYSKPSVVFISGVVVGVGTVWLTSQVVKNVK